MRYENNDDNQPTKEKGLLMVVPYDLGLSNLFVSLVL